MIQNIITKVLEKKAFSVLLVIFFTTSFTFSQNNVFPQRMSQVSQELLPAVKLKRGLTENDFPFDQSAFTINVVNNKIGKKADSNCLGYVELSALSPVDFANALIDDSDYKCYYYLLYNFDDTYSPTIHSNANIQEVFRRIKEISATYDGTFQSGLYSLITYIHQTIFHEFYQASISLDNVSKDLYVEAVEAVISSSRLKDINEEALTTLYEFGSIIDSDGLRNNPSVIGFVKDLMRDLTINDTWKGIDSQLEFYWGRAYNQIFFLMSRGGEDYKDAVANDPEFVNLLAALAIDDELTNSSYDYLVGNAIAQLAKLASIPSISEKVCDDLFEVVKKYPKLHPRWITAVNAINRYGNCTKYDLCYSEEDIQQQLTDSLFKHKYEFDNGSLIINASLDRDGVQELYHALKQVKAQFYRMQQTDDPTMGDTNEVLTVYLFPSRETYQTYAGHLFGIASNNGGMYIEQIATFYTFDRTSGLPLQSLFRHEYVHYLQGRNWVPGYWGEVPFYYNERLTSIEEGSADFFAGSTATGGIKMLEQNVWGPINDAPNNWPSLKTILKHEYDNYTNWQYTYGDMVLYNWYKHDFKKIKRLIDLLRADNVDGYDAMMDELSSSDEAETQWRAFLGEVADGTIEGWNPTTEWINDSLINASTTTQIFDNYVETTSNDKITVTLSSESENRRFKVEGKLKGNRRVFDAEQAALSIDSSIDSLLVYLMDNADVNNFRYSVAYYKDITIENDTATATFVIDGPLRNANVNDDMLVCDFKVDEITIPQGSDANFVDLTMGYPTQFMWTFEGGTPSTSTDKNPIVKYDQVGKYKVSLTVSNGINSDTSTKEKYINVIEDTWTDAIYLSDIDWESATSGWLDVQKDKSIEGNVITINGTKYKKGLGTHATSTIIYNLNGEYSRFLSDIGLDDESNTQGSIEFEVWGDGKILFQSRKVYKLGTTTGKIDLDISGVDELRLVVTEGDDSSINSDHGDWASARLLRAKELGEENLGDLANIKIYPNPVSNYLYLANLKNQNLTLSLIDVSGRVVLHKMINGSEATIGISALKNGIYTVLISSRNKVSVNKIIVIK
jgi:PKD repeat protein